ncbi:glycosyltransferase family 1 protein [Rossellomorea arthrocnemi]
MEPIRVLQVVTIMNRGGLETMLMNYYRQIDRTRIQFDFMVHREEEGHYDKEIKDLGGNIYKMPPIKPGNYRRYFKMLDIFFESNKQYFIVHSHINENSSFVLKAAKKAGVPCRIAHSHLSDLGIDYKIPFRIYARLAMGNNPNSYFACSKEAGKWLFGSNRKRLNNIIVLNNAVNTKDFKYDKMTRKKMREDIGATEKQLVIGHIGRFNKQKNHSFLIDIFKEVSIQKPDSILILAGDGHLRKSIEKKVDDLGLNSNVKFLGVREDIPNLMQAMDVLLFPSLFEGLPVVLVEAQAAGLTSIVSDSITTETNVTGKITFESLASSPQKWANLILSSSYEHEDTAKVLSEKGYDTKTMSNWLTNYYMKSVSN